MILQETLETMVRERWRKYAFTEPQDFLRERLWWFRLTSNAEETAVFFSMGDTREEARERLECSLRVMNSSFMTLWEFDSGEVLGNVPVCAIHQTPMFPKLMSLWRFFCLWNCGSKGCPGRQWTFRFRGHPSPLPYIAASLGTAVDIGGV